LADAAATGLETEEHEEKELAFPTQLVPSSDLEDLEEGGELAAGGRASPDVGARATEDGFGEDGRATPLAPIAIVKVPAQIAEEPAGGTTEEAVLDAVRELLRRGAGEAEIAAVVRGMLQANSAHTEDDVMAGVDGGIGCSAVPAAALDVSQAKAVLEAHSSSTVAAELRQRVRASARPFAATGDRKQGAATTDDWKLATRPVAEEDQLVPYTSGLEGIEAALQDLQKKEDEARAALTAFVSEKVSRVQESLLELQQRKDAVSGVLEALQQMV
jgi:hypothetical protein